MSLRSHFQGFVFFTEKNIHGRGTEAGNLRIMFIFGSTFGPFGGLCNTAESFGPLSKLGKPSMANFLRERGRHWAVFIWLNVGLKAKQK